MASEATTTTLTFTFLEIPCGSRKGNTQYQYEIKDLGTDMVEQDATFQTSVSNEVNVVVSNLRSGIQYSFRVRGSNGNGHLLGPYSGGWTGTTLCE